MKTAVCLHASTSTSRQWRSLGEAVAPHVRLITPDLIGYGRNPLSITPFSIKKEIDYLCAELDDRSPFHLVGHSYGGFLALHFALRRPAQVMSLTLYEPTNVAPLLAYDPAAYAEIMQIARLTTRLVGDNRLEEAAALFVEYWNGEGGWRRLSEKARQAVVACMPKVRLEFAEGFKSGVDGDALTTLQMPTLVLIGSETTPAARAAAGFVYDHLANVEMVELDGLGHMGPVSRPEIANPHITKFLIEKPAPPLPAYAYQANEYFVQSM